MGSTDGGAARAPTLKDNSGNLIVPCFIDGKAFIQPPSANFEVVSARTEEILHYGQNATQEIATSAVNSAATAFKTYKKTPPHQRRKMLLKAADLFEQKAEECLYRQMQETSCDTEWARFNVFLTCECIRGVAAGLEAAVTGAVTSSHFGHTNLVFKEPIGTALLIPPWNAALVLNARSVANILAAGCTVVMKASELCPWTHQLVAETFLEAGFPPGSVNMIMADRSTGPGITENVIAHPSIRKVEFIGSAPVGRIIGSVCAKHLKPIFMELGDQSPAIVLEDADLQKAAQQCAQGSMAHQGQVCFSTERIIVLESIKDEFSQHLVAALDAMGKLGGPAKTTVTKAAADKAKYNIDAAVKEGAKFLYGSSDMSAPSSMAASILTDVHSTSAVSSGEAFAPTALMTAVDTEEEAIAEANSKIGGLSASVFTKNYERALRVARELEFGGVQINNMTLFAEPSGPSSAVKGSGWGSTHGRYGIEEFLYNKTVSLTPTA